jgi:cyclophilin family peptidyl-prolyl cis-trans isomerase
VTRGRLTRPLVVATLALTVSGGLVGTGGVAVAGSAPAAGFEYGSGACPPEEITEPVRQFDVAPQLCIDPTLSYEATFVTSEGAITVALDTVNTPGTTNNFVVLARYRYYDDTPIFRADPRSGLFQGGGADRESSPGYRIPDEGSGYTYRPGTLAMARTPEPHSAGGQWFFTTSESASYLDDYGTFVVFGFITEGLDVAQAITALGDADGVPSREVTLETVVITEGGATGG